MPVGFGFCLGRIYALSMLMNLNSRGSLRRDAAKTYVSSREDSEGLGSRFGRSQTNTINLGGIRASKPLSLDVFLIFFLRRAPQRSHTGLRG